MKVRFLADADLNLAIVTGLRRREPAVSFLTAHAAGLRGLKDKLVLELAAREDRVLVSHDATTMPRHFRGRLAAGGSSAGVFLIPQGLDVGVAINERFVIWLASEADAWKDRLRHAGGGPALVCEGG